MKICTLATLATALAVATLAVVSLAGCNNLPEHRDSYRDDPMYHEMPKPSKIYLNEGTGKVTKFIDGDSKKVLFEEGYTKQDLMLQYGPFQSYGDETLATTVLVNEKPYPVTTKLRWSWAPLDITDQIALFNADFATSVKPNGPMPSQISISGLIQKGVMDSIRNAIKQGVVPALQHQATGRTVTTTDERIVAGWKAGTPAWKTLQDIKGSSVGSERYSYSFMCATYDVNLTNSDAVLTAIKALPHADLFDFSLSSDKAQLLIETAQPCGIQSVAPLPESSGLPDGQVSPSSGNSLPDKYVSPPPLEQKSQSDPRAHDKCPTGTSPVGSICITN